MRLLLILLFLYSSPVLAQNYTINNSTINIQGTTQNILVNQIGANHSINLNLLGNNISVIANQSGLTPQNFSLSISCGLTCPNSPYIVNQY